VGREGTPPARKGRVVTPVERWRICRSLYVIEIGDDRIKVGIGADPASRLADHRSTARMYGVSTGREWVSPRRAGAATERALIAFCADRATEQFRREYFAGVRFDDAVRRAAELTLYTVPQILYGRLGCLARWTLHDLATVVLATTEAAVRDLAGVLAPSDPGEDPPTFTREAIAAWLDTQPDLLSLPRGGPRYGGSYGIAS
jgi:hypothetical protein